MKFFNLSIASVLAACAATWALPAFPGAEGYGGAATGGRGGRVYCVTTLADAGMGSLRIGLMLPYARIIVFKVSGVITVTQPMVISSSNVTVAGETAPGAGITVAQAPTALNGGLQSKQSAGNYIIRFLRIRGGTGGEQGHAFATSVDGTVPATPFILDHLSCSWSCDEMMDFCNAHNFTVQWSFLTEAVSGCHPSGRHNFGPIHSYGMAARWSFHHCLLAKFERRYPLTDADYDDIRNNLNYNWEDLCMYWNIADDMSAIPYPHHINLVNSYWKRGPNGGGAPISVDSDVRFYIAGNTLEQADGTKITTQSSLTDGGYTSMAEVPSTPIPVTTHTADQAYTLVLDSAGVFPRDTVDRRNIQEVKTRTVVGGLQGPTWSQVSGTPLMAGLAAAAYPTDTDRDGMPDCWETNHTLNPNDSTDATRDAGDGYNNIEKFMHYRARVVMGQAATDPWCGSPVTIEEASLMRNQASLEIYGNPFHGSATFSIKGVAEQAGTVQIVNTQGQVMKQFAFGASSGSRTITWNGLDNTQRAVAPGVYLLRVVAKNQVQAQKKLIRLP
jgi:hypothetical protein